MTRYAAFLRGINISGKNKISMAELKVTFEEAGFTDVSTYLNSGNVVFCSDSESDENALRKSIEKLIAQKFSLEIPVYIIQITKLQELLSGAPDWWGTDDKAQYDNLIFILSSDKPEEICKLIGEPTQDLERIQIYKNVIFWTFDRSLYQKCNWWKKTATNGIAEKLTIRTANTIKKICS